MNRYFRTFIMAVATAGLLASCNREDIGPEQPDVPSVGQYEQLTFSSADEPSTRAVWNDDEGRGSLIFNWEADYYGPELVTLLTGEESFIPNYPSAAPSADELDDIQYHSYMAVSPKDDPHRADFTTLRYYNTEDQSAAKTVFAVTPINTFNTFEADETSFKAKMEMPATFVQLFSQNPEFLRDYMMMYGQAKFENGSASIPFKHIPATFRFIITNKRPVEAKLETVGLTIDDTTPVGSKYAEINGRYDTESLAVEFPDDSYYHNTITTLVNTTLQSQESYIAYALVLPLTESESFEGKELKFVITTTEHDFLSFVLDTEQISNVNPGGEYNWVGGKSYTIRMSLDDVLTFEGISVADWTEMEVGGGVAEEVTPNTFDATAMTPEQLNAVVTEALEYGHTSITVNLAEDADATMFTAITAALAATVDPTLDHYELSMLSGTIDLTISGAKTVPESTFDVDEYMNENWRAGATLRSVTVTDAITIGDGAFFGCAMTSFSAPKVIEIEGYYTLSACNNLIDVYLPSVQTLESYVFGECPALKTISLPECVDLGSATFVWCESLETVYAPKATNLGALVFKLCTSLTKVTLGSVESVNQCYEDSGLFDDANDTQNIELVLSSDQKVLTFDSSTTYWTAGTEAFDFNTTSFIGYTFKSIAKQE